jgi:hypothetical protein
MPPIKRSTLTEHDKEDLVVLVLELQDKLHKKKRFIEKIKRKLVASRQYNGRLTEKVVYLRSKVVDYYKEREMVV